LSLHHAAVEKPVRVPDLRRKKELGEKIAMLTVYDATMARLLDRAGVDVFLVGDSLGMVILGHETTVPVTLEAMIHHTAAVTRGTRRALVVADMPFLTYQLDPTDTIRNAGRLIQQGGAAAVKLEGAGPSIEAACRLVDVGIPVMAHLGLTPQHVHRLGGFRRQAVTPRDADQLAADALALEHAGAFAVVLESVPAEVARRVTAELAIPTIGIGAGPHCDGQVLVSYDIFGLSPAPPFARQYAALGDAAVQAAAQFVRDVREGSFPEAAPQPAPRNAGR
jgi:3-methyl-2-oxobutanoate hydroxymethyltransferase